MRLSVQSPALLQFLVLLCFSHGVLFLWWQQHLPCHSTVLRRLVFIELLNKHLAVELLQASLLSLLEGYRIKKTGWGVPAISYRWRGCESWQVGTELPSLIADVGRTCVSWACLASSLLAVLPQLKALVWCAGSMPAEGNFISFRAILTPCGNGLTKTRCLHNLTIVSTVGFLLFSQCWSLM